MQAKTERFEMRLDQGTISRLDAWRGRQDDLPSRAEAVRRLMETELGQSNDKTISLSNGEKLILKMLCGLYKHFDIRDDIDPEFVEAIIHGGHYWGLEWKYPGLFHGHGDKERTVSEVLDVLEMWSFIERGYSRLSQGEKDRVEREAEPFGKHVEFRGFDGNNEAEHLGVAHFLIDQLDRFADFKGRDLNAHMPTLDIYRRMLAIFGPIRATIMGGELKASQIIELLKAQTHPEYRK